MTGPDRAVAVLGLFTLERPSWTIEEAAAVLQVSVSSAYRYVATLTEAGFLTSAASGHYVLGPAIIQYDRQIQLTDPLLQAAKPVMAEIVRFAPGNSSVLLCRLFRETVLCVHDVDASAHGESRVSYERGRPMPLFRGATSKIILAYFASRDLRRLYDTRREQIAAAGLGKTWDAFRSGMAQIRKAGHSLSEGDVDPGVIGIAVPVLDDGRRVLGSLTYVIPVSEARAIPRLVSLAVTGAREIEEGMRSRLGPLAATPPGARHVERCGIATPLAG